MLQSDKRFQEMCYYLARKEFPHAIHVAHGSWDGGRDIVVFADKQGDTVWQCKYTQRSLSELKPQIVESLNSLDPSRRIAKWILCVSVEGSGAFLDWLREKISHNYPFISTWEVWDKQVIIGRLDRNPEVLEMFFYPIWKALESRFRTEELELVQYELDTDCGWQQPDPSILYFWQAAGSGSDLVIDIIVRSRGTIQSLMRTIGVSVFGIKRHLRGLPGTGLLYPQFTYAISLRGGEAGSHIEKMEPPLVIEAGKHERFKVKLTNSGSAWTGYIRMNLAYGNDRELPLPCTFLRT